jgi:hypothetical protein
MVVPTLENKSASWSGLLEVANTVLWMMLKHRIAMHGSAWHCSIAVNGIIFPQGRQDGKDSL